MCGFDLHTFKDIKCYAITEVPSMPPCLPSCPFWHQEYMTGRMSPVLFFITADARFYLSQLIICSVVSFRIQRFWVNALLGLCSSRSTTEETQLSFGVVGQGWDSGRPSQKTWTKQWRCCLQLAVGLSVYLSVCLAAFLAAISRLWHLDLSVLWVHLVNWQIQSLEIPLDNFQGWLFFSHLV